MQLNRDPVERPLTAPAPVRRPIVVPDPAPEREPVGVPEPATPVREPEKVPA